jgi:hypothetical protein
LGKAPELNGSVNRFVMDVCAQSRVEPGNAVRLLPSQDSELRRACCVRGAQK